MGLCECVRMSIKSEGNNLFGNENEPISRGFYVIEFIVVVLLSILDNYPRMSSSTRNLLEVAVTGWSSLHRNWMALEISPAFSWVSHAEGTFPHLGRRAGCLGDPWNSIRSALSAHSRCLFGSGGLVYSHSCFSHMEWSHDFGMSLPKFKGFFKSGQLPQAQFWSWDPKKRSEVMAWSVCWAGGLKSFHFLSFSEKVSAYTFWMLPWPARVQPETGCQPVALLSDLCASGTWRAGRGGRDWTCL